MTRQIKYSIFCNRKRFNVLEWLERADEKSYKAFCSFLTSRNVLIPDEDYFSRALNHFNSTRSVPAETISVDTQPVVEEVVLPVVQISDQEVKKEKELEELKVDDEVVASPPEKIPPENVSIESEVQIESESLKEVKKTTRRKRRRKSADTNNEN
tara:strand:+ start:40 stop:504 length:465 start_codon:yes stop_codon:yes gene_type:complete